MSYTFLLEQGEESSVDIFSDIPASVLSRSTSIAAAFCSSDSETVCCHDSPSGTISAPSTAHHGEDESMSCAEDSPARIFPRLAKGLELLASEAGCGARWHELYVKYNRNTSSWKTHRCLFSVDLDWCSLTLPKWGLMRHGELYRRKTPRLLEELRQSITNGSDYGCSQKVPTAHGFSKDGTSNGPSGNELGRAVNRLLKAPTPQSNDYKAPNKRTTTANSGHGLAAFVKAPTPKSIDGERGGRGDLIQMVRGNANKHYKLATPTSRDWKSGKASQDTMERNSRPLSEQVGGSLNPPWVEWLMNWPLGWSGTMELKQEMFNEWKSKATGQEKSAAPYTAWDVRNMQAAGNGTRLETSWWSREPAGVPRVASSVPHRVDRLRAIGNGQVPIVAAIAFRMMISALDV